MGRSLLFLVSGLTIITGIIQVNNSERVSQIPEVSVDYYNAQQARNLSKSLIDNAVETMKANNNWAGSISIGEVVDTLKLISRSNSGRKQLTLGEISVDDLLEMEENLYDQIEDLGEYAFNIEIEGGLSSYTQASQNKPANNSVGTWDEYKVLLVSNTIYDDVEVTTEVLMQRDSFSKYSYNTQSELSASGTTIWFMDADNIYGPIHTNGQFAMSGNPSFYGLITSPNMWRAHSTNPTNPNFYGGENFNAPTKTAPSNYEVSRLVDAANDGGKRFAGNIDVDFYYDSDNGFAHVTAPGGTSTTCTGPWWRRSCVTTTTVAIDEVVNLADINGVISTDGDVSVEGDVNGSVTIHAEGNIEIMGDIVYKTSPLADSSSTDLLGLVSENNVTVDRYAHSANGTQDLIIHGSIVALNTSFTVENYNSGSPRGTLNMLGGLIQENRGAVGTFSGSTIQSGFSKNYQYDNRLKANIPPSFPRESVFSIVYWKDEVKKISD